MALQDNMKNGVMFLRNNYHRQLQYRTSFFGYLLITGFYYLAQFVFFNRIFDFNSNLGGYSLGDISLMLYVFINIYLCVEFSSSSVETFFNKVYHGGIEPYLTKPVAILQLILLGWCFPANLLLLVFVQILVVSGIFQVSVVATSIEWMFFLLSIVCSVILNICFILVLNLMTFVVQRKLPVDYIHSKVFELSMVPISLYPRKILAGLLIFVPVALSASLPVSILKGHYTILIVQVVVTCVFLTLTIIGLKKSLTLFEGMGG